jgi:proline iminopeptidase
MNHPRAARLLLASLLLASPALAGPDGVVPRDGFALHYKVVGERGPSVVILSGGPGLDVDYMASVAEGLDGYRAVFLEQRGTGRSVLPVVDATTINWAGYLGDLEALRVQLGEEKLTLLGHSWGMTYALAYAARYPDRVRGVVTLGSAPITAEAMAVFDENRSSRLHPSEREALALWSDPARFAADPDRAAWEYLRAITPTDFYDRQKGLEHAMRWKLEWCHGRIWTASDQTIWRDLDLRRDLPAIRCPVLFVHGYQDVTGEANMIAARDLIRGARLEFVRRSGHYPWLDQPEATWRLVRPFLESLGK